MFTRAPRRLWAVAGLAACTTVLAACSPGDLGSSDGDGGGEGGVELSFLVDNTDLSVSSAEALAAAFEEANPDAQVEVESRPQGGEGDNLVKTRLATGDMADVFAYNSGSLFAALNPQQSMAPVTDEPFVDDLAEAFVPAVSVDGEVYGAPFGTAMGGGVLYNKAAYEELGLEIPTTWDEFMANNEAIKAAGRIPVIQTYKDTWTSQLFVLGDFHNVSAAEPGFAEDYTAGRVKYATSEAALRGFEHLQEVQEAGYVNPDFASAAYADGIRMVATGEGVHYPMLSFAIPEVVANYPDNVDDVGFFALPGDDADANGLTVWAAGAVYIANTAEGETLDAAKRFLGFIASPEGCDVQTEANAPNGPYMVEGCELPADVPPAVQDIQAYFDREGGTSPALEFLSPVKGPALEQITVEVGSGIRPAEDAAALYDEDAKKQAQQLGIEGW